MQITYVGLQMRQNDPNILAVANITLDEVLKVNNLKVVQTRNGIKVKWPIYNYKQGIGRQTVFPLSREFHKYVEITVIIEYLTRLAETPDKPEGKRINFEEECRRRGLPEEEDECDLFDDNQVLSDITSLKRGDIVMALLNGEHGYKSHSEADFALCCELAYWTKKKPVQMDRLFRKSRLWTPKWDESFGDTTYGQYNINKAISQVEEVYNGEWDKDQPPSIVNFKGFM